jgi:hypothetical protein
VKKIFFGFIGAIGKSIDFIRNSTISFVEKIKSSGEFITSKIGFLKPKPSSDHNKK